MSRAPWGSWKPASLSDVHRLFSPLCVPWWIAGGYAIELAVGHPFREHEDIDVLLLRRDQRAIQRALTGWQWWAADPPGELRRWMPGTELPSRVQDVWCRPGPAWPWRIQVMLEDCDGPDWVPRRNQRLRRPIGSIGHTAAGGVPYLAPEIQLFYKAATARAKDETDFAKTVPLLTPGQRKWLDDALADSFGEHPWRHALTR